ncbi:hypothetical protein BASA61_003217 [Batrachochytrium salamandrivorans]|nr:hypothetical protein BASA60_002390 [Batrachochytrium salamandrivorans]KAH6597179.1 hypothetical protein BASA61_003217 [Batrachochytrium salamandrivorans]KAH9247621.1 hypothetical protein BASA81_014753 [Batrachochytrium salamandrivorans]
MSSVNALADAVDRLLLEPSSQTPASEKPILNSLTAIRTRLSQLLATAVTVSTATDSSSTAGTTAGTAAVAESSSEQNNVLLNDAWLQVVEIVKQLTALRSSSNDQAVVRETDGGMHIDTEVDLLLDDVVPMFFQVWSKAGKVPRDMYKTYVHLTKILHMLNKLYETGLFTNESIQKIRDQLSVIWTTLQSYEEKSHTTSAVDSSHYQTGGVVQPTGLHPSRECFMESGKMLAQKHQLCLETLHRLQAELDAISPILHPIHDRLVEIKQELESLLTRRNPHLFSLSEVQVLQDELREIDSARIDGKYIAKDDGSIVSGQACVIELLEACFDDVHELMAAREVISGDNPLQPVYEDLVRIKGKLERLLLVGHWTIKSGDLVPVQMRLGEIDNLRVDGKFMDEQGGVPPGQAVLHFLLHKCYRLVYKLQMSCEPVADSLMPIYNQLRTLQRCINELKRWRVALTPQELIPYQLKLSAIDGQRQDGKFLDESGEVPGGQGILHDLLSDCYELLREMQMEYRE